jgi:hypothetical protein
MSNRANWEQALIHILHPKSYFRTVGNCNVEGSTVYLKLQTTTTAAATTTTTTNNNNNNNNNTQGCQLDLNLSPSSR